MYSKKGAMVGRWRWGECGFRGGNSLTLRFLAQVVKRSLLASYNVHGRAGGSMYINQSMEGRRCGRSSSVWSVGESSSVLYVSAGEPLRCDASISTDPVTLGGRRLLGGLSATAARWSPNCAGEFRPGVDAGVDCGLRSKGGVRAAAAMRGSGGDTKGFVEELSSINGACLPWYAPLGAMVDSS